jgi:hypothetical protein
MSRRTSDLARTEKCMTRPPKKSETLEIRLSHDAKQAFMACCRAEGLSASEALRRFIEQSLAPPAVRRRPLCRRGPLLAGAVAAVVTAAAALPSLAHPSLRTEFDGLDLDHSNSLNLAEVTRGASVAVTVDLAGTSAIRSDRGAILPVAFEHDARGQAAARLARQAVATTFASLDRNHDGAISFAEFSAAQR